MTDARCTPRLLSVEPLSALSYVVTVDLGEGPRTMTLFVEKKRFKGHELVAVHGERGVERLVPDCRMRSALYALVGRVQEGERLELPVPLLPEPSLAQRGPVDDSLTTPEMPALVLGELGIDVQTVRQTFLLVRGDRVACWRARRVPCSRDPGLRSLLDCQYPVGELG